MFKCVVLLFWVVSVVSVPVAPKRESPVVQLASITNEELNLRSSTLSKTVMDGLASITDCSERKTKAECLPLIRSVLVSQQQFLDCLNEFQARDNLAQAKRDLRAEQVRATKLAVVSAMDYLKRLNKPNRVEKNV